jgi:superoxide reductase
MDRRTLIRIGLVGSTVGLVAPKTVLAGDAFDPMKSPIAGTFYYTKDAPGRWSKKVGGHLPTVEKSGNTIEITTGHPMKEFEHYIVKHQVFDSNFALKGETMFDPLKDAPVSTHDVSGLSGLVYVMSVCNIHDSWLNVVEV